MPHDFKGKMLNPGDLVTVDLLVTQVMEGEHYCNLNVETVEPMFPGNHKTSLTLNGKQVRLKVRGGSSLE